MTYCDVQEGLEIATSYINDAEGGDEDEVVANLTRAIAVLEDIRRAVVFEGLEQCEECEAEESVEGKPC